MTLYDSHLFIKKLSKRKDPSVHFKNITQTDERFFLIFFGRLGNDDCMNFMIMSVHAIFRALDLVVFIHLKKTLFGDKWENIFEKHVYHYKIFETPEDFYGPLAKFKNEL